MDCIDCHNRPTHAFELPENGVDLRMSRGLISPELPYIHKKAVEMLKAEYPNRETAGRQIVEGIEDYYRTTYPEVYNGKRALVRAIGRQRGQDLSPQRLPGHERKLGCPSEQSWSQ
jgi:hypothetical protein